MSSKRFDAIVIGAGPGGSTIAALLANSGKRVLLVDKNSSAGGKMMSIYRDGHTYEMFPLNLVPNAPSLFEKLSATVGKSVRNVAAEVPADKTNILYGGRDGKVRPLDVSDFSTFKAVGIKGIGAIQAGLVMRKLSKMKEKDWKKLEHISALEYMNSLKMPEAMRVFVTASFGEGAFEMTSDKVPASHLVRIFQLLMSKDHPQPRYYEGGVGGFFTKMVEVVPEHGGEILWNTRVKSIDTEDGKAVGVTFENGESFVAPLIISNAGLRQTVFRYVGADKFPKEYAERIRGLQSNLADVGYRFFTTQKVLEHSTYVYFPYNCLETWHDFELMRDGKKKPTSNYIYIGSKSVFPTISANGKKQVIYAVMSSHPEPEQDLSPYLEYVEGKMKMLFPKLFEEGVIERREVMGLKEVSTFGVDKVFDGQGGESYGIANSIGQSDGDRPTCNLPIGGLYCVGNDVEGFGVGTHRAVESGFKVFEKITGSKIL
ncbi:FAD dependent oxidoreductase [Parasphaerochaeta coccoides DSM 17374]|uniref:FAD dependent oxidoreductase n=2 Tax=Parasphaerochaeta TaxID=3062336 RepID=F4GH31_PARC1|nr:FAD dependent oxidoreductase [Parasphaerochaeta coccoides DSM 17374]